MAFNDIARSKDRYDFAIVFRGTFDSGASVVWSNRAVKTSAGLLDQRIISVGPISRGVSEMFAGVPPRVSCSVELANHDNGISTYVRGNSGSSATADYGSDGLRNLSGKFYMLVKDPADGSTYESAITPTMVCSGGIETDGFVVRFSMASRDESTLGASAQGAVTVQMIKDSTAGAFGDGEYINRAGTSAAYAQASFTTATAMLVENLDTQVPYAYGKTEIPLIPVGDSDNPHYSIFMLFVSTVEPNVETFANWELYSGQYGTSFTLGDAKYRYWDTNVIEDQRIYKIKRVVPRDDGTTTNLWIVFMVARAQLSLRGQVSDVAAANEFEGASGASAQQHYAIPSIGYLGISFAPPAVSTENKGPVAIIRAMSRDHATQGASALHDASFLRAGKELQALWACGGLYYGERKLVEAYSDICRAFGFQIWVETDDKLHAFAGWGQADKDEVDAGTPYHITQAEILDGWKERVPDDTAERGAAIDRLLIKWDSRRAKFYPSSMLPQRAYGATDLPAAEIHDDEMPGAWLFPVGAVQALDSHINPRSFIARRVEFVGRAWLATQSIGTIFFVSHSRGLADNSGTGYVVRPMRLEWTEYTPGEDGCRVVMADLGGDYATKPSTLDTIDNWIATQPSNGDTVTLTNADTTVTCGVGNTRKFSADDVGRHLWTFGAANDSNRRSRKIVSFTSATEVEVEYAYSATETLTATATTGWESVWLVMDTQASKGSAYRPSRIRLCVENTGLFRDGSTAGYQVV